jgi:dipeptidyl aminopeptidase/acylaminoacyl peptidase
MSFDYKGWGDSEGPKSRLAPYSRVADVQAALTFLGAQPEVDAARLGIYGTSYGGATVVFVAAVDLRVKCVVSVVGVGNGARWMRSVRRPDEYHDLLTRAAADRDKRVLTGVSDLTDRNEVLLPDRQSAELGAAARRDNPAAVTQLPLEFVDDTLGFNPEWIVDRIAPRPVLFITTDDDRLVPPQESEAMFARAGEPKKLVVLRGFGHYEVYGGEAFRQVMDETVAWYKTHLRAR